LPAEKFFRISAIHVDLLNLLFTPFHFPPRGKGFAPSPLGEGWEGGFYLSRKVNFSNQFPLL